VVLRNIPHQECKREQWDEGPTHEKIMRMPANRSAPTISPNVTWPPSVRRNLHRRDGNPGVSARASYVGPRRLSGRIGPARRLAPHSAAGFEPFLTALWKTAIVREPVRRCYVLSSEPSFSAQRSHVDRCNGRYCVAGTEIRGTPLPRRSCPALPPELTAKGRRPGTVRGQLSAVAVQS